MGCSNLHLAECATLISLVVNLYKFFIQAPITGYVLVM